MSRLTIIIDGKEVNLRDHGVDGDENYWVGDCPFCEDYPFNYFEDTNYYECEECNIKGFYNNINKSYVKLPFDIISCIEKTVKKEAYKFVQKAMEDNNNKLSKALQEMNERISSASATLINYSKGLQNVYDEFSSIRKLINEEDLRNKYDKLLELYKEVAKIQQDMPRIKEVYEEWNAVDNIDKIENKVNSLCKFISNFIMKNNEKN